ncbi:GNAT family N-acetyltransferase [Vibrio sonorensis]|uniref:GNAT family N-acetyltransferase n=1 Tax=Vibrio sonorensis TaxID=1004316 RepID=UPI0008D9C4D0|nr:GNAT family N-acetyltransferase [Vibrio sonorensis]
MNQQLIIDEGHRNTMSSTELEHRMSGWLATDYQAAVFYDKKNIAGYCLWKEEVQHIYIRQFFICRSYRQTGIGKTAFNTVKSTYWNNKRLRLDVLVTNHRAKLFWQSVGFKDYCTTMEM